MKKNISRGTAAFAVVSALLVVSTACAANPSEPVVTESPASSTAKSADTIAAAWVQEWESGDATGMAELFASDGVYTDNAFGVTSNGRDQVAGWVRITGQGIVGLTVDVASAFGEGEAIAVVSTLSGQLRGAPQPFSVPMTSIITVEGDLISSVTDTYNLAAVLKQSGLPADFDPTAQG